ncbi:ABC transporter ATP-binding protein [Microlunatus elymi]|uniref:ABC transporter ATP-binding protein n=1 Tax=Microlunatus elymi TaxID=2596828 RepID=A0A516Q4V5_9ACTN|nr:ABC transporter ATP-binding protein [Microlunatus elymi]QDP98402.1 ABC transporter ATP-binding protein [Microlunatus elymi]
MGEADDKAPLLERLTGFGTHIRLMWTVAPGWSTFCLAASLLGVACNIANMIVVGRLVGALSAVVLHDAAARPLWGWFVVFAVAAVLGQISGAAMTWAGARTSAGYRARLDELIGEAGLQPADLGTLEDEKTAQRLSTLAENSRSWLLRFGMTGSWEFLVTKLTALGAAAVVFSWHWWVPLVIIACFVLVSRQVRGWLDELLDNVFERPNADRQRADYISRLMIHPEAAKEIRVFGIAGWLEQRYVRSWHAAQDVFWPHTGRRRLILIMVMVAEALVIGGSLALLGYQAYVGAVAVGLVTTYLVAILGLEAFGPMGDVESGLMRTTVFLRNLVSLRRSLGLPDLRPAELPAPTVPSGGALGIEVKDLTFGYPSRTEPTLRGLSLEVPPGQSLAVVGVNGAGKSTLIKLIAGLYRPDQGSVRVGGGDPFVDVDESGRVAVVFQDFVHYPLSLRDNVAFGAMGRAGDDVAATALQRAAGDELLAALGDGWDTPLSKDFEGGTDLSGGQWQRVALARALAAVAGGAGVLVLDEPTAALDVRAEAAIFDRFLDLTHGVTTILVSHRLSTVRRAERIVVLDGNTGRISEDGSHQELMAAGGAYAEMFTLQARRFALAGGTGDSAGAGA